MTRGLDDKARKSGTAISAAHRQGILGWQPSPKGVSPSRTETDRKGGTRPVGLGSPRDGLAYIPESADPGDPRPLLIMFHGAGASAADVMPMIAEAAERQSVMVLAPDSRGMTWDVLQRDYGPDVAFLDRALDVVFQRRAVDLHRIAFAGFSDGGSYALSLGLINGDLISDVLAFSPGFIAPTRTQDTPRFFISHGREDPVLPVERCGRRVARELRQSGYEVEYNEFSGGHVVPTDMIEAGFRRFLR